MKQFLLYIVFGLTFIACQENPSSTDDDELKIVTTTGMLGDLAQAVAGEHATVTSLMGPGVDPHLYKATQGDLKLLREADIVIYNGLHLEGKMGEVLEKLANFPNKEVIAAAEVVDTTNLIIVDEQNTVFDPHIWFDVNLWQEAITPIEEVLSKVDADHAASYSQNAESKRKELTELHNWVQEELSVIPENQRILITAHDAFEYFGKAYNIEVKGLQGISTLSEAGIRDVKNLVDMIVDRNIKAVFIESSVPVKSIEAVVEGAKEKGHTVEIGGTLFSDAMGKAGTPEGTYKGMVKHNIQTIVEALK